MNLDELTISARDTEEGTSIAITGTARMETLVRCVATLIKAGRKLAPQFDAMLEEVMQEEAGVIKDESHRRAVN